MTDWPTITEPDYTGNQLAVLRELDYGDYYLIPKDKVRRGCMAHIEQEMDRFVPGEYVGNDDECMMADGPGSCVWVLIVEDTDD